MDINDLTYKIRGAIFTVHKTLGHGLLESVYEASLLYELLQLGLKVVSQAALPVNYNGVLLELGFRIELMVEDAVIIEIKSVEALHDVHKNNCYILKIVRKEDWYFGKFQCQQPER